MNYGNNDYRDYLAHYGTPRHSGRYPYGSGKNPRAGTAMYYAGKPGGPKQKNETGSKKETAKKIAKGVGAAAGLYVARKVLRGPMGKLGLVAKAGALTAGPVIAKTIPKIKQAYSVAKKVGNAPDIYSKWDKTAYNMQKTYSNTASKRLASEALSNIKDKKLSEISRDELNSTMQVLKSVYQMEQLSLGRYEEKKK